MRSYRIVAEFLVFAFVAGAAAAAPKPEDSITPDTFIALCDGAKATVDPAKLKALLTTAQAQKPKAEAQLKAAEAEASKAVDALADTALQQGLKIDEEVAALNRQIAAATGEKTRLTQVMVREGSGTAFQNAYLERDAKMKEIEALEADVAAAEALRARVAERVAEVERTPGYLAKADIILSIASDLGVMRTMSFASPIAKLSAATLTATAADATAKAAASALDCVSKKLATIEDAKAQEAKFLLDGLTRLGQEMRAKGEELTRAKKAAQDAWAGFSLGGGKGNAKIEQATDAYWVVINQYLDIGQRFQTQVNQLAGKGIKVEPWMTQLTASYVQAKKVVDETRAKGGKR